MKKCSIVKNRFKVANFSSLFDKRNKIALDLTRNKVYLRMNP